MNQETDIIQNQIDLVGPLSEIIRKFERYNSAVETKNIDSQEASQKVVELQKRFQEARDFVKQIPGIDQSKQHQIEHLENLKKQLQIKQELISKYKHFNF